MNEKSLKEQMLSSNELKKEIISKLDSLPIQTIKEEKSITLSKSFDILRSTENYVKKFYLDAITNYKVNAPARSVLEITPDNNIKLYRLNGIVYNKKENILDKLNNVYSSMHSLNLSIVFFVVSDGNDIGYYIGTKTINDSFLDNESLAKAFEKVFDGNFPGSNIEQVDNNSILGLLGEYFPENGNNSVTSLTSLPSLKNNFSENNHYVQGIEKFIETMQGEKFALMIISDPVSSGQVELIKQGYEELYTSLSPMSEFELSLGENQGVSISNTETEVYIKFSYMFFLTL